jgi:rfaE bifunctional protein nucleotidyltransferase chain/domain
MSAPILPREELSRLLQQLRQGPKPPRVVLTNGGFDLLHVGHLRCLWAAKAEGQLLVVALNADAALRAAKGPGRPHVPLAERLELVAGLKPVDFVTWFEEPTLEVTLRLLLPDVHAKGTDYSESNLPEAALNRQLGIRMAFVGDAKQHHSRAFLRASPERPS